MSQPRYEACGSRLGMLVILCWGCALLAIAIGMGAVCGIIPEWQWRYHFDQSPSTTPECSPLSGLVYVSPAKGECTALRPKLSFGYGLPEPFAQDYMVCYGLQVEILEAFWADDPSPGCYLYLVRVPNTINVKGWIAQDELTPALDIPPLACPSN